MDGDRVWGTGTGSGTHNLKVGTGDRDGDWKFKSGDPGRGLVNFYAGPIRLHLSLFVPNLKKKEFLAPFFPNWPQVISKCLSKNELLYIRFLDLSGNENPALIFFGQFIFWAVLFLVNSQINLMQKIKFWAKMRWDSRSARTYPERAGDRDGDKIYAKFEMGTGTGTACK